MKTAHPILVIDRFGLIGEPLAIKLSKEFLVFLVSRRNLDLEKENKNLVHIPFFKKFPLIPDNKYSHIIFIDEEVQDLDLLPSIIKKVKSINADFISALGLSEKAEYVVSRILRSYSSAKVVLFGDIFDDKLILRKESFRSVVNKFIFQAQRFGKIQILGEGLRETYPVFLNDVTDGLIDLVFGIHKSHSLFYLFPKHPPTELSLSHMIQKMNPEVIIDFVKHNPKIEKLSYPPGGLNLLSDKYPLAKKIRAIDIKKKVKEGDEDPHVNVKKFKSFPIFIIWVLIFLFFSPLLFTVLFSFLGLNTLYYAKGEIDKGNFTNAKSSIHLSKIFFYAGKQTSNILSLQAKIIGKEKKLERLSDDIGLGYKISESLSQAFKSEIYFSKIFTGKSENPIGDLEKGKTLLKNSIVALDKIKAEGKIPASMSQNLEIVNPLIKLLSNTSDIIPNIFGMEGPRNYLILFQNNMILRPGGGLIGSYGILKFNMGKITEFSMYDVDDADKQLRGHVEPPFGLRRHLPEQHWYMRDSNFDVDFVRGASSSSNFLFVETEQKVSGVIGVDVSFVKNILHAIGPVYVENYKETVDEDNLFKLAATQKKDFLRSLYKAIMAKISGENVPYLTLAQAISDSLAQKHLVFSFDNNIQNIFTVNGWSSSLWDERKEDEESINDFLGISEANLGVNKANYFIKRNLFQKVTIGGNGSISEELTISYKNESTTLPGGDYKNYLRIILPKNTSLSEVSINNKLQDIVDAVTDPIVYEAKGFKAPLGLEVEKDQENGKLIYGFLVNIPAGEIVKIKLKYILPGNISGLNTFSYSLKLFKQPGVDVIPYSFVLTYPKTFNNIKSSDGIIRMEGKASYEEKIVTDKSLILNFAKK